MWQASSPKPSCKHPRDKKGSASGAPFFQYTATMNNRHILLLVFILIFAACRPEEDVVRPSQLSPATDSLIAEVFAPFRGDTLIDHHVHIVGLGNSSSGIQIHADMQSYIHPFKMTRFSYFMDAAGVSDTSRADQQYLENLLNQMAHFPIPFKIWGLALDKHYLEDGSIDEDETEIYVPNRYLVELANAYPHRIIPAISVHPYRQDAVKEVERWAAQGVRVVKWVPNAMGIDPSSALCDSFYAALQRLDMVLLSHAGTENAIDSQGRQHLGNPLLLRRALAAGVKVIIAHCAVAGSSVDLDDPDQHREDNFKLFLRLMDEPAYVGLLYGDISAMTLLNQVGDPLKTILARSDLHGRLLYGSDYPLPAVRVLNNNSALTLMGYLDQELLPMLEELQTYDPLLYNFVLVRSLQHPETGVHFPPDLFRNQIP